jgi:DNA-binding Lrp family transcriptional regulator
MNASPAMTTPAPQPVNMDDLDRRLLNALQNEFPLEENPWSALGAKLGLGGDEVLTRVAGLKQQRVIRQISPIFDTTALGYTSMLVAGKVDPSRIEQAAAVINAHPGVSHNYERLAEYNLWFTLAVPPGESIDDHLARLSRDAGLEGCRPLPTLKLFKIGVKLDLVEDSSARRSESDDEAAHDRRAVPLSARDRRIVARVQDDLPLVATPFADACVELGLTFNELRDWFAAMQKQGALRRIAAILRHRSAGFTANGMGVWRVREESIEACGAIAAGFAAVSHCYQRPSYSDWPYNLYTMIHARAADACQQTVTAIAAALGEHLLTDPRVLYSTREFKKQRVRYFV